MPSKPKAARFNVADLYYSGNTSKLGTYDYHTSTANKLSGMAKSGRMDKDGVLGFPYNETPGTMLRKADRKNMSAVARQLRHDNANGGQTMDKRTRYRMQRYYNGLSVG